MSYRPPDWDKRRAEAIHRVIIDLQHDKEVAFVESGADAIVEALKSKSPLMTPEQMKLIAPDRKFPFGYLVFIPEDMGFQLEEK